MALSLIGDGWRGVTHFGDSTLNAEVLRLSRTLNLFL